MPSDEIEANEIPKVLVAVHTTTRNFTIGDFSFTNHKLRIEDEEQIVAFLKLIESLPEYLTRDIIVTHEENTDAALAALQKENAKLRAEARRAAVESGAISAVDKLVPGSAADALAAAVKSATTGDVVSRQAGSTGVVTTQTDSKQPVASAGMKTV